MSEQLMFCAVPLPYLVYVGPRTREEFDRIALPETVHEWSLDPICTLIKHDGQEWERRCHSKALGDYSRGSVSVVFQWFDERPAGEVKAPEPVA
jgi:hypothetical protein